MILETAFLHMGGVPKNDIRCLYQYLDICRLEQPERLLSAATSTGRRNTLFLTY